MELCIISPAPATVKLPVIFQALLLMIPNPQFTRFVPVPVRLTFPFALKVATEVVAIVAAKLIAGLALVLTVTLPFTVSVAVPEAPLLNKKQPLVVLVMSKLFVIVKLPDVPDDTILNVPVPLNEKLLPTVTTPVPEVVGLVLKLPLLWEKSCPTLKVYVAAEFAKFACPVPDWT